MGVTDKLRAKRRALICGVSGQDGAYLALLLLGKGYEVWGTSRDAETSPFYSLKKLGIFDQVKTISMSLVDFRSVLQALSKINPDEVYNLAGQSSVSLSFDQPVETLESITLGTVNLLESIRFLDSNIRLYNAGSSECFGDICGVSATENTAFHPKSPYAIAKAATTWQVDLYRQAYGLFACTGIMFNHESPLRSERFVTRKIIAAACRIAQGSGEKLELGNIEVHRDWGWAPEYVDAMWRILNHGEPQDFIIATGVTQSLRDFLMTAFDAVNLDWNDHVQTNPDLLRPSDPLVIGGIATKAKETLLWEAEFKGADLVRRLIKEELNRAA